MLIYGYLLARIHFGFYPAGENLPSIYRLSDMFGVSTMTAREAIRLLEEKGYVHRTQGKRSVVIDGHFPHEFPASLKVPEETLQDLYQSLYLLLPSIFYHSYRHCGEKEKKELIRILERSSQAWDEPTVQFLFHVVRQLKNPLLNSLYVDTLLFSYPAHLARLSAAREDWKASYEKLQLKLRQMLDVWEQGDVDWLWKMIRQTYLEFDSFYAVKPLAGPLSVSYRWGRPIVVNSIARELIFRIYCGLYPVDSFLPSPKALAADLSVPLITIRRAIGLLNKLGIAESVNGKGTRVLSLAAGKQRIQWKDSSVRKNVMTYLYALHVLALTCGSVAAAIYPLIENEAKDKTGKKVRDAKEMGHSDIVVAICLDMIIEFGRLEAFKNIYSQLLSLLVWGYPLTYLLPRPRLEHHTDEIIAGFEADDGLLFAKGLEKIVGALFLSAKTKILSAGILEAESVDIPFLPKNAEGEGRQLRHNGLCRKKSRA
ncbi:GntR family transcriptional regulator [Oxalobacter paraformigenes]|uniref:GntR family transcriptional regulator n=1 Tax=Oxalobacter paraformigenes TaxID=556268 RepID=UPI0021C369CE|nr:GntR family transcriptional regulator [Oxalobacter paraformigenes]